MFGWPPDQFVNSSGSSSAEVDEQPTLAETIDALNAALPAPLVAVICGGDSGICLADALSVSIRGCRPNCTTADVASKRRDKHWQAECVARAEVARELWAKRSSEFARSDLSEANP